MAIFQQDDTPTPTFQWGANGARMTPDQIAASRRVADAMAAQAGDASPFPTGTRGTGLVTQGLSRLAKGISAGLDYREADNAAAKNADDNRQMIAALLGGNAPAQAAAAPVAADATSAPRGIRNNNPLNIEDGAFAQSQPGYAGTDGRFAKFETPDHGTAAANTLLDTYQAKHGLNSVAGIVNRWAPASDGNNVNAYATDVAGRLGVDPNAPLTPAQRPALIAAMSQHENGVPTAPTAPAPGVAKVSGALSGVNPAIVTAATSPYADSATKSIAGILLAQQLGKEKKDTYSQQTDADGNVWNVNNATGQRTVALKATEDPQSVREYEYYKKNLPADQSAMPYDVWSTAKARAGATNVSTNVDTGGALSYDKQLAEGLGKSHAALANGVEDAQARARDLAAMQGAVDQIQKNGGTTGGMGQQQALDLKKTINAGANALGIETPFNENDLSDKEFLTKFNRSIAGAQAKGAVGSRVTNFELSNYLKANPGLDMSITGNQRLLGIQSQIEQRNIAVGNAIRDATAAAISKGQKIDPVTVQGIITDYDKAHHIQDPVTGQDLTQSYALPEFQQGGNNAALAVGHETNLNGIRIKRIQ